MKTFVVGVVVSRTYHVEVKALSEALAEGKVWDMQTTEIAEQGSLQDVEIEHVEVAARVA